MKLDCAQIEERLSDYLDHALAPEEQAAFFAHLDECGGCSRLVLAVQELTMRMPRLAPVAEPAGLERKILEATLGDRNAGWRGWFGWLGAIWQPQFAIGIATAAVSLMIALHAIAPRMQGVTAADLTPTSIVRTANRQAHLAYAHSVKFVNDLRLVYEIQSRFSAPEAASSAPSAPSSFEQQPATRPLPRSSGSISGRDVAEALDSALSEANRSFR